MKFFSYLKRIPLTPEERKLKKQHIIMVSVSAVLLALSFPPVPLPYLMFFALVPYFFVLEKRNGLGEINRITYLFGFIFSLLTIYWVGAWSADADPYLMIAGIALLFFNPTLFLIPSTLYYMARKVFNARIALLSFPLFWVTYEYVYGITDIRFPWLILGHGLAYFKSYIQIADIIGAYGLTILVLSANIFIYLTYKTYREEKQINKATLIFSIALIVIPLVYGIIKIKNFVVSDETLNIGLVQPNFNPWNKWDAGNVNQQLDQYLELSQKCIDEGAGIVAWPETALPVYLMAGANPREVGRIRKFVNENSIPLLTGMPDATFYYNEDEIPGDAKRTKNSGTAYTSYNSILLFNPFDHNVQKYGKVKLVGFGERVPFMDLFPFLQDLLQWSVGISNWNAGKEIVVFEIPANSINTSEEGNKIEMDTVQIGGLVCIESVFSDFTAEFVQKGANLIAVVTNDSWWGDTSGPYQHKEINVIRAVENRRSVFQAANGGVSCLIDPLGNTILQSEMLVQTYMVGEAPLEKELTFFTRYPKIVFTISYVASLIVLALFIGRKIKLKRQKV
ncbi:apolipoprotein N-acyltransferase [Bacteroidota bacterium]